MLFPAITFSNYCGGWNCGSAACDNRYGSSVCAIFSTLSTCNSVCYYSCNSCSYYGVKMCGSYSSIYYYCSYNISGSGSGSSSSSSYNNICGYTNCGKADCSNYNSYKCAIYDSISVCNDTCDTSCKECTSSSCGVYSNYSYYCPDGYSSYGNTYKECGIYDCERAGCNPDDISQCAMSNDLDECNSWCNQTCLMCNQSTCGDLFMRYNYYCPANKTMSVSNYKKSTGLPGYAIGLIVFFVLLIVILAISIPVGIVCSRKKKAAKKAQSSNQVIPASAKPAAQPTQPIFQPSQQLTPLNVQQPPQQQYPPQQYAQNQYPSQQLQQPQYPQQYYPQQSSAPQQQVIPAVVAQQPPQ